MSRLILVDICARVKRLKEVRFLIVFGSCFGLLVCCSAPSSNRAIANSVLARNYGILATLSKSNELDSVTRQYLEVYEQLMKRGTYQSGVFKLSLNRKEPVKSAAALHYLLYGDIQNQYFFNDSLAYRYYRRALEIGEHHREVATENAALQRLLGLLLRKPKKLSLYKQYLARYQGQQQGEEDYFWTSYYKLSFRLNSDYLKTTSAEVFQPDLNYYRETFDSLERLEVSKYSRATGYQMRGIYCDLIAKEPAMGAEYFIKAQRELAAIGWFYSEVKLLRAQVNEGIALKLEGDYQGAIKQFMRGIQNAHFDRSGYVKEVVYQNLSDCYGALRQHDSAHVYLKKRNQVNTTLGNLRVTENIFIYDYEQQLKQVGEVNKQLTSQQYLLLAGAAILAIGMIIVYRKWKRTHQRKQVLESENERVKEEIKTIRSLVDRDRIVLKNKAFIHLEDLRYIKVEDHYLWFYTASKREFERGKLKDILLELPPNFVRCHRSYIVNKNYIEQRSHKEVKLDGEIYIPISRMYKDEF